MTIDMPSTATITCDGCGKETEVDLTDYANVLPLVGIDSLPDGWTGNEHEQFCPECSEE